MTFISGTQHSHQPQVQLHTASPLVNFLRAKASRSLLRGGMHIGMQHEIVHWVKHCHHVLLNLRHSIDTNFSSNYTCVYTCIYLSTSSVLRPRDLYLKGGMSIDIRTVQQEIVHLVKHCYHTFHLRHGINTNFSSIYTQHTCQLLCAKTSRPLGHEHQDSTAGNSTFGETLLPGINPSQTQH